MGQGTSAVACAPTFEDGQKEEEWLKDDLTMSVPDECLAAVFEQLGTSDRNRCSLVCKRWHKVEGQARQRLSLQAKLELVTALPSMLLRFQYITKLALKCDRKVMSINDDALCMVGGHFRQLRKLKLKACKGLTDEGIDRFAKICGPLKKLSCGSCGFGARGLNSILLHCANLEDLTVKRLRGLYDGPSELIHPGRGNIRRLCLKELHNAHLFGPLISGSKNVHTLTLARNTGNWDKLLQIITDNVTSLVELHMEKLDLSDQGLLAISRCKNLEVLYVVKAPECTNYGLTAVAVGCRQLRKLHLDGWKNSLVGDEGLAMVARKCQDLEELVLVGLNVTLSSLSLLASNCFSLERLAICSSETFGDLELSYVAQRCLALKKLCIKACPISDKGMEELVGGCPSLLKIKVKKCRGVTPVSLAWLQTNRASLVVTLDSALLAVTPDVQVMPPVQATNIMRDIAPVPPLRSGLAKARLAIMAGSTFMACTFMRWSAPPGS